MAPISVAVKAAIPALERFLKYNGRAVPAPDKEGLASLLAETAEIDMAVAPGSRSQLYKIEKH
jgi:hypothetical protein